MSTGQATSTERGALQVAVAIGGLVPVSAGLLGLLVGPALVDVAEAPVILDSHFRYLSGLLLGIGLAFWTLVPQIERHGSIFRLLTAIVFIGGLGRLLGVVLLGWPDGPMAVALGMELVVTPSLCLWQYRIATTGAA